MGPARKLFCAGDPVAARVVPSATQRGACASSAAQRAPRRPSRTGVCIASTSADPVGPRPLTKTYAQPCLRLPAQGYAKATRWPRTAPLRAYCPAAHSGGATDVSRRRSLLPGGCRRPARAAAGLSS
jgi:hypothetical protein